MAGAVPRVVTLHAPDWTFDPRELEAAVSGEDARPAPQHASQPDGQGLLARRARDARARSAGEHDALCITDEVYEHLVYEGRHVPMAALPGMRERTITISSFGKTFSLTGLEDRLGGGAAGSDGGRARRPPVRHVRHRHAAAARRGLGARGRTGVLRRLCSPTTAPGATISSRELARLGFELRPPQGTYFVCADFRRFGFDDDRAFVRHLIEKAGVAAIPPSVFYDHPEAGPPLRPLRLLQEARDAGSGGRATGEAVRLALVQMDLAWEDVAENHRRASAAPRGRAKDGGARARAPARDVLHRFLDGLRPHRAAAGRPVRGVPARDVAGARSLDPGQRSPRRGSRGPGTWPCSRAPDGSVARYAKIHPFTFGGEHRVYAGGERIVTVAVEGVRVTPFVCYDLRFPEPFRLAAEETDLFAVVANWPEPRREKRGARSCAPGRSRTSATSRESTGPAKAAGCATPAIPSSSRRGATSSSRAGRRRPSSSPTWIPPSSARPARSSRR